MANEKIFFSYGHDENREIVHLLAEKIKNTKKYDVWIDSDKIQQGKDWRTEIEKGIQSCDQFVAFMSEYSMRDKGVCHDELQIALCVRGVDINTVLMEEQQKVNPPSIFCHKQWIDMSGWREAKAQGDRFFKRWLDQKYEELLSVINNNDNIELRGDMQFISAELERGFSDIKIFELMKQKYTPVSQLEVRINEWLVKDSTPICVLYGGAGSGKSLFSANQAFINPSNLFVLFCDKKNTADQDCITILKQIILKLCFKLPNYRNQIKYILEEEKQKRRESGKQKKERTAEELLEQLIVEPLRSSIDGGISTFYMLIDGLDEAGVAAVEFSKLLVSRVNQFPQWIRILITCRDNKYIKSIMVGENILELNMENYIGQTIREMICSLVDKNIDDKDVLAIESICDGCTFYAKLICDDINNGKISRNNLDMIPKGIYSYYLNAFNQLFIRESDYWEVREVLNILCVDYYIPEQIIQNIFPNCADVFDKLNGFVYKTQFVIDTQKQGNFGEKIVNINADTWCLIHKSLGDWLRETEESGKYSINVYKGIQLVAQYCLNTYRNSNKEELTSEEILYVRKNLCTILAKAEMWAAYCALLDEYIQYYNEKLPDNPKAYLRFTSCDPFSQGFAVEQSGFQDLIEDSFSIGELKDLFRYVDMIPRTYNINKYVLAYKRIIPGIVMEYDCEKGYSTPDLGQVITCLEELEIYTERFLPLVFRWLNVCCQCWEALGNNSSYEKKELKNHINDFLIKLSVRGIQVPRAVTDPSVRPDVEKDSWWYEYDLWDYEK